MDFKHIFFYNPCQKMKCTGKGLGGWVKTLMKNLINLIFFLKPSLTWWPTCQHCPTVSLSHVTWQTPVTNTNQSRMFNLLKSWFNVLINIHATDTDLFFIRTWQTMQWKIFKNAKQKSCFYCNLCRNNIQISEC